MNTIQKLKSLRRQYDIATEHEHYDLASCVAADAVEYCYVAVEEGSMSDAMGDLEIMRWKACQIAAMDDMPLSRKDNEQ